MGPEKWETSRHTPPGERCNHTRPLAQTNESLRRSLGLPGNAFLPGGQVRPKELRIPPKSVQHTVEVSF